MSQPLTGERTPVSVVVAVGRAGRAVVPTLRAILAPESPLPIEVVVVCSDEDLAAVTGIVDRARLAGEPPRLITAPTRLRAAQRRTGVEAASHGIVAVVDAGDIVDVGWLDRAAARLGHTPSSVMRPGVAITFGMRSGWWPQPEAIEGATLLPLATPWASAFLAARETLLEIPAPLVDDDIADAAWQALLTAGGRAQSLVSGTAVFVRVWTDRAPWELHRGPLPASSHLVDRHFALAVPHPAIHVAVGPVRRVANRALEYRGTRAAAAAAAVIRSSIARARRRIGPAPTFPSWVDEAWRAANRLEPLVTFPRPGVARWYERVDRAADGVAAAARAYWDLVRRLGSRADYLYLAPWVRTGGGDSVLLHYLATVRRLDPDAAVALLTTEPVDSPRLGEVADGVRTAELRSLLDGGVSRDMFVRHIVPQLMVQLAPTTIHAFNSTVAFDVIEQYGESLAESTTLALTTFAIDRDADGERLSVLFLRRPGFLDPVRAVFVDSHGFVERVTRELGYDPQKFVVQRSVVPAIRSIAPAARRPGPVRVFWAGRFDLPKRLDVLASVAERARAEGVQVEIHFYGIEVMGTPGLDETLGRLEAAGAVRHPAYRSVAELPLDDYDAYILTSEWEGIPLTVLEAMRAGIPVVAPLVGSVGEVVDEATGYPVERFDDAAAYVEALRSIGERPGDAAARTEAATRRIEAEFSEAAFDDVLRAVPSYLRPSAAGPEGQRDRA